MKKILSASAFASFLLLAACGNSNTASVLPTDTSTAADYSSSSIAGMDTSSMPANDPGATQPAPTDATSSAAPTSDTTTSPARVITMHVSSWQFSPNVLTLKKGEKVVIHLIGDSGMHSFSSQQLGINVPISAGETQDVTIPTDSAGTFSFRCGVPCGEGHHDMTGQIIIEA